MGSNLKLEFINYLINKSEKDDSFLKKYGLDIDDINSISIFMFAQEFKDFIQDEYNVEQDVFSINVADITNLEIKNGKIISPEKEENNDTDIMEQDIDKAEKINTEELHNEETGNATEEAGTEDSSGEIMPEALPKDNIDAENQTEDEANSTNKENISYLDILNTMFEDEEFLKEFDTDGDGMIGEEEFSAFQDKIKALDGKEEDLSFEDIINKAKETFEKEDLEPEAAEDTEKAEDTEDIEEPEDTKEANKTDATDKKAKTNPGGGYSGGGVSNYNNNASSNKPRGLEDMSVEELQGELAKAESDLSEKQETLTNISNGTDPQISELKEKMESSLEDFNEALKETDDEDAKELAEVNQQISEREQELQDKDNEIFNQEATVQEKTEAYEVASSNLEDLKSRQQILNSTDTSEMSDKQKQVLEERKNEVAAAITQAEADKQAALDNKTDAEKKLDKLKEEKENLENGKPTLEDLEEKQTDLEEKLSDLLSEEPLKSLKEAYETAKTEYETQSATALTEAQQAVTEASNKVTEVNNALTKAQERENERNYRPTSISDDIIEFAKQFEGYNESNGSANIFLGGASSSSIPWCAAFVEYIMKNNGNYEDIPDWYKNIDNKWYCPNVYNAASSAGAITNASEAEPGDIVLFELNGGGGSDHIGIYVGRDENGNIITIEGNTSNCVAYRSYNANDGRLTFCKIT